MKQNLKKFLISCIVFCGINASTFAQVKDFEEFVPDSIYSNTGPNAKNYFSVIYGIGTVFGENIETEGINTFYIGAYYKRKFNNIFSLGFDYYYGWKRLRFDNNFNTQFIDTLVSIPPANSEVVSKNLNMGYFGIAPFMRVNFDPNRKNNQGIFLDIGILANFQVTRGYSVQYELEDFYEDRSFTGLRLNSFFNNEVFLRLGYKKIALQASHTINNYWNSEYKNFPAMAPIYVSLQLRQF